jgi:hypothetical protein
MDKEEVRQWVVAHFHGIVDGILKGCHSPGAYLSLEKSSGHEQVKLANKVFAEIIGEQVVTLTEEGFNEGAIWYPNDRVFVNIPNRANFGHLTITLSTKACGWKTTSLPFDTIAEALAFISERYGEVENCHTPLNAKMRKQEAVVV